MNKCKACEKNMDGWCQDPQFDDARQYAAIQKVEADYLRRQRDELKDREVNNGT